MVKGIIDLFENTYNIVIMNTTKLIVKPKDVR